MQLCEQRFFVGDLAILKYVRSGETEFWQQGVIVEIIKVSLRTKDFDGQIYDYVVRLFNGGKAFPIDPQLKPLDTEHALDKLFTVRKINIV